MDLNSKGYTYVRGLIYIPIFLLLHYLFDWFPNNVLFQIFSGTEESVFQHMKIGFYAYFILTALEFGIFKKKISDSSKFLWSRLMGLLLLPWLIFVFWYTIPAVYGFIPFMWLEILYANICVYLTILFISIFERAFHDLEFTTAVKTCLLILLGLLILEFTLFSFKMPWADLFAAP